MIVGARRAGRVHVPGHVGGRQVREQQPKRFSHPRVILAGGTMRVCSAAAWDGM